MKIVMLESLGLGEDVLQTYAKSLIERGHEFVPCTSPLTEEEKIERIKDASIAIIANGKLSGDVIRAGEKLEMISIGFTGIDHLDGEACKEKNLTICNAQGYATECTAEMTIGLMLALLRHIVTYNQVVRNGGTKDGFVNHTLHGKTVGIVGTGAIGLYVAKLAKAFGAKLIGYNPSKKQEAIDMGLVYMDLDDVVKEADILTLHAPATKDTENIINLERIGMMKKGALLINCARGTLVDNRALAVALNEGYIGGAGIDVFETEPPITIDHSLFSAKNVIVAPHVAYFTEESFKKRVALVMDNIIAYLDGVPINVKEIK